MEKRIAVLQDLCSTIKNIDPDGQGLEECLDLLIPLDRQKLSNGLSLEIILEDTRYVSILLFFLHNTDAALKNR